MCEVFSMEVKQNDILRDNGSISKTVPDPLRSRCHLGLDRR